MAEAIQQTCPWCNRLNDATEAQRQGQPAYCPVCGHRTDVAPDQCDCRQCLELDRMLVSDKPEQESKQVKFES
jgi:hypothetical protein